MGLPSYRVMRRKLQGERKTEVGLKGKQESSRQEGKIEAKNKSQWGFKSLT